ncbi:hypothetical protein I302_102788 [Kwoniella bestiolae CBS 10118]|uniref:Phosphatidic acid phosphatase type 2/haloperoxidase domain-containing protein n=1 Tax=Kwoniella bestiolae CBS 10118 TaxID=1296100 RepID=A0A1B9GG70_9TREE|nr:hypothetical protein I302_01482 [Kwoniella bestiolae CBS 10118]OCF29968.1 hypothetical protein I302_01482 [Kwoniella bestiolae CBS 10118]
MASPRVSAEPTLTEKPRRSLFGGNKHNVKQPIGTAPAPGVVGTTEAGFPDHAGQAQARQGGFTHDFKFGSWIRLHAVDLITMAAMGAIGLGVYEADPAPTRSFPVFNIDGSIAYPEFAYPLRKNIIPIWLAALLAFIVPFAFFALFQIRIRNLNSFLGTTMGLLESLITAAVFQVFHKWLIGGLRPHFLDVCKPDVSQLVQSGDGFRQIMYTRAICTGDPDEINDSLESWMSGHSTAAFAGFVYLFFYFNAQLKVMADHRPAYWKMILTIAPLLGASLIAASLTIDEYHNWYDCVGGALTGTLCAIIAYRKTFAALWDFRFNHIMLPRSTSLFHRRAIDGEVSTSRFSYTPQESMIQRPAAAEGGWRRDWGSAGAPGDATAMMV